jgi:hypothetical protein
MKTIKFIAVAILSLAILNSCTEKSNWYTDNLEIKSEDWKLIGHENEIGSYYEYVFYDFPYVDGIVSVYMYQDFGSRHETQIPLPYTFYWIDILDNGEEDKYSIQYSYDIAMDGSIAFKVYVNDYITSSFRPATELFRVAIVW